MVGRTSDWKEELGRFLKPFLGRLGHKARRQMCPLYVSGLIGPGDRKSIQPMAERLALGEYDQLHHFIAAGVWDATPVETELLVQADRLVGGSDAVLVIDDTAIPKKGTHSVGVAAQYASALGKTANCQTLVSLTLARGEVPVMLALRLFLPESWTSKRARLERAGVPAEYRTARTKPEMALAEINRAIAAGVRFGCVLADAGYGLSAPFRQGLTARKLAWAVGIPRHLKVYPADVQMVWPVAGRGRPRQRHVPDILSIAAEDMLADAAWQDISWRTGTKGKLKAHFAVVRVRVADGPPQRIRDKGQQHLPGDEAWLIGEHRMSGEKKYYLANLPAKTDLRTLAATIKARWICEQAHQQMKEELGLDHFEGRSWQGLHRHALMTMIAYAFLQHRRLAATARKKKNQRAPASANFARRAPRHPSNSSLDYRRSDARIVEDGFAASSGVSKSAKVVLVPVLFFVFAISFTTWPPGPLSMTYFMAVIVWIWARMWGLLYRPIEGLGDELNIVYRKLVKGGPPLVALLFLWGAIDASIDLERVTNPYLVRFKKQDTAELRILLRSFDRGLLMKNAFSNRVEFYQWDDLSTIERRPSATTESLLCYLFGYVCRTKQPPTP